ncbi:organic cation transporter protein-like [Lineus longissimus]|uniref:organic cation transporter protein-like n=1 Tax=Lineus longissimus TaxID=88925 RepID=UPI00315C95C8
MAVPKQNILGSLDGKVRTAVRFKLVPSFEDILEKTGNFGIWQMLLYLIYLIIDCSIGLTFLAAITATEVPGWKWSCSAQGDDITNYNFTANGNTSWCPPEGIHCENITFENSLSSIVTEWNLICDKQHITRDISTLYFAGLLLGALTGGCSSDFLGRRKVTLISWPLMMLFQTFTGVSVSWFMYLVLRIATGFATGCCLVPAGVLAIENMGTKSRVVITHRLGFSLAFFMTAVVSFLLEDWRHRAYATGLLLVPAVPLLFLFLPESPRWLLQKNRIDEAEIVVKKIAKFNRRPCPNVTTLTHLSESNMKERRKHGAYTVLDLFATREFGSRTLVICYTWFASYVTTFGTVEVIIDFNVALALKIIAVGAASLIAKSTTIYLVNRLGRKRSFLANVTLSTLSNIAITALNIVGVGEGPNGDAILASRTSAIIRTLFELDKAYNLMNMYGYMYTHTIAFWFFRLGRKRSFLANVTLSTLSNIAITALNIVGVGEGPNGDAILAAVALAGLTALCSCHMVQICFSAEIYPTLLR